MIKKVVAICIGFALFVSAVGCQTENEGSTETANPSKTDEITAQQPIKEGLITIPLSERRFVYTNGLTLTNHMDDFKENSKGYYYKNYPIISGIKNKDVEKKLNNQIQETMDTEMQRLEQTLVKETKKQLTIDSKQGTAFVAYNCNNVIFIDYSFYLSANIDSDPVYKSIYMSHGYDLNTGDRLKLEDLFVKDSNYKELINNEIVMYIIENNFDDPETEVMKKPFQGIREDQNFSFNTNSLRIIINEKNDEFANPYYQPSIDIPLLVFEDTLAIFDKYYDENVNLFEKEPMKHLMPNRIEYKETKSIDEYDDGYQVYIRDGEFINVDNEKAKKLLDALTMNNQDLDELVKEIRANKSGFGHHVYLSMNAGGYISAIASDWSQEQDKSTNTWRVVNYDLNKDKQMKLKDLFVEKFDYKAKIAEIVVNNEYYQLMDGSLITKEDIEAISEDKFSFYEGSISISFDKSPKEKYDGFVTIGFDHIGMENLAIYN